MTDEIINSDEVTKEELAELIKEARIAKKPLHLRLRTNNKFVARIMMNGSI